MEEREPGHFSRFFSAVTKLWNAQETLKLSNIRFGYLQYFFAFPLAMIFAMSQFYILQGRANMFGLGFTTLGTVAFCVGGTVFLITANEKNISTLSKVASILAFAGLLPYFFMPDGVAAFVCASMLMAGIGGCVSLASYSFGFVLNNTERFLGSVMMLLFNAIIRIITDYLPLPVFFMPALIGVIALGIIVSLFLCKTKDFDMDYSSRGRYNAGIWLVLFLFFAYYITKALGINVEDFHQPFSDLIKGVSIVGVILLCLVVQMVFKRGIWTMCNIFFLATIGCYVLNALGERVFADIVYGFKEIGLVISFYMIGCVTNRFSNFKMHKRLLFMMIPVIIPVYIAADLMSGTPLINPAAIGISSALFVIFLLLSPAFSKHLFSANWSDSLYHAEMTGTEQHDVKVVKADQFDGMNLTPREKEIAVLLLQGMEVKQAALELGVKFDTAKFHVKNLYKKLDINSRAELLLRFSAGQNSGDE